MRSYHLVALIFLVAAVVAYLLAWHLAAAGLFVVALLLESFAWAHLLVQSPHRSASQGGSYAPLPPLRAFD